LTISEINQPPIVSGIVNRPTTIQFITLMAHTSQAVIISSAVCRLTLPSDVRTATPAFDVRSSGLFCGRPGGLELVTEDYLRAYAIRHEFL